MTTTNQIERSEKTFNCWAWNRTVKIGEVIVQAVNAYEAQKKAARKLGVKMLKVGVREIPMSERKDLFVCVA